MVEIEFLDPEDSPHTLEPGSSEEIGRAPGRWAALSVGVLVPSLLLIGAAALAVAAAFQSVYVVRQTRLDPPFVLSVDGWGRITTGNGSAVPAGVHEARYGIPLCGGAGVLVLFLIAALAASAGSVRARRMRAPLIVAAGAATGGLGGVFAAMWLAVAARFSGYRSGIQTDAGGPFPLTLSYGASLWLLGAAVAAGALGIAAVRRQRLAAAG
jgi:hypothetical protein